MKPTRWILLIALFWLLSACQYLIGQEIVAQDNKTVEIYGKISVKGNGPHTYLCLSTETRTDYRLTGPLADAIQARYQQQRLRLKGRIESEALGPGFPAVLFVQEIVAEHEK